MSNLHAQAKPILLPIVDDSKAELTENESGILARWAAMVVVNIDYWRRDRAVYPMSQQALRDGAVPPGWRFYVGILPDSTSGGWWRHTVVSTPIGAFAPGEFLKVTLTTFVIERVIFRLVGAASQLVEELVARCVQPVYNDNTLMEFQRGCENLMISGLPKVTWNDAMQVHERMAAK